jgi:hypothetical protein
MSMILCLLITTAAAAALRTIPTPRRRPTPTRNHCQRTWNPSAKYGEHEHGDPVNSYSALYRMPHYMWTPCNFKKGVGQPVEAMKDVVRRPVVPIRSTQPTRNPYPRHILSPTSSIPSGSVWQHGCKVGQLTICLIT